MHISEKQIILYYISLGALCYYVQYLNKHSQFVFYQIYNARRFLNGLKNDPSYEFIGEAIFKINVV